MKKIKNVLFVIMTVLVLIGFMLICLSICDISPIYQLPMLGIILILPLVINTCLEVKEISDIVDINKQIEKEYEIYKKSKREEIVKNALEKIGKSADEIKEKIINWDWSDEK